MKKASVSVALQIAQILNDNERRVITEAVELLRRHGGDHELLAYLVGAGVGADSRKPTKARKKVEPRSTGRGGLKGRLSELRERNPEVYKSVLQFEELLAGGRLLERAEEIRKLGQTFSKNFKPGKSRGDAVNSLILELLNLSDSEILSVIRHVESGQGASEADGFQKLAHYLIGSRSS